MMRTRPDGLANGLNVISITVTSGGYIVTARMTAPSRLCFRISRCPSQAYSDGGRRPCGRHHRTQGTGVCQPPTLPPCRNTDTWPRDTNAIRADMWLVYGSSQRDLGPSPIQSMRWPPLSHDTWRKWNLCSEKDDAWDVTVLGRTREQPLFPDDDVCCTGLAITIFEFVIGGDRPESGDNQAIPYLWKWALSRNTNDNEITLYG